MGSTAGGTVRESWPTYAPVPGVRPATRTVEVRGAWVGATWVDHGVLDMVQRSAEGGFPFRVRSEEVADALVGLGLATRDAAGSLRGERVAAEPTYDRGSGAGVTGWCASTHHLEPVPAVVEGRRGRSADDPWAEEVGLCGRCADLMGSAGFFRSYAAA